VLVLKACFWYGDLKEAIEIGILAGLDSDNPATSWGGIHGFMLGKEGIENVFIRKFANKYNIHRTRRGFPDNGVDTFYNMPQKGVFMVDRIVQERMKSGVDLTENVWFIPDRKLNIIPGN
jgi:hypothetical protein